MYSSGVPARKDHDLRRLDISEAVWRVLAAHGVGGLNMRAVAGELNATTGLLTHYFPNKRTLVRYALDVAEERTQGREMRTPPAPGLPALRTALLDVLPLDETSTAMNRVWVSSWDAALADGSLGESQADRYVRWRDRLRGHIVAAQERGDLPAGDADDVAASAAAFAHGLVVQALFDPPRFPANRQIALLDGFLRGLCAADPRSEVLDRVALDLGQVEDSRLSRPDHQPAARDQHAPDIG
jgi:AcrR family transcriptional regulator